MRVFLIAGEPSGDRLGGALMEGLKQLAPGISFEGVGGPLMQAQGMTSLFPMEELSVMGLAEVLPKYRHLKLRIAETARAALGTHYATIEMLHLIGATDQQIARLFQRRITIDTAYGVALGTAVAAAILLLIGWQWSGVTSGLAATASLGPMGWALLLALPLLAIALAALTARQTLLAALKKIL